MEKGGRGEAGKRGKSWDTKVKRGEKDGKKMEKGEEEGNKSKKREMGWK